MLISIIIPAYNADKYIGETIQSVMDQSVQEWELLVVVDGATDQTAQVAQSYADKDRRIQVYTKPNSGVSGTRNFGLEKAKGDFIAFLDADDTWLPENLERKLTVLHNNPEIMWVFSDMNLCDHKMENPKLAPHRR